MNSTINVRVDKKLKEEANEIFDELGIGMTSAMTMFLKAVVRTRSIPFSLDINKNPNRKSVDKLAIDLEEENNKQHLSPIDNVKEAKKEDELLIENEFIK